ncbi:MAG: GyrI-like domain-containing protein [Actinomycetota bacterium]|nr:GyrI-like domain-containing protein [Actinomycetota bacterium]
MATAKVDFKRELREFYTAKRSPTVIEVPELAFLMIDGHGDPNTSSEYREAVSALFSVSYTARFALKRAGIIDFGVMPLEGLWWASDMSAFSIDDKSAWYWTMMIMQPDEVTANVVTEAKVAAAPKVPVAVLDRLRLERFAEGPATQVLHVGPYSAERPTVASLHEFIAEQGRELAGKHHEIYLGDPRRSAPEKLKTIIRQPMR